MSEPTHEALHELRDFLYRNLYENPVVHEPFTKARAILTALYRAYTKDPDWFYAEVWPECPETVRDQPERAAADYLASMTDRYALDLYTAIFFPSPLV